MVAFFYFAGPSIWSVVAASAVVIGSVGLAVYVWSQGNVR
jgi:hypothetical protein